MSSDDADSVRQNKGMNAGSGESSSGESSSGEASSGEASSGEAGSGEADNEEAGNGEAGNEEAGSGEAGSGEAGSGDTGSGEAGTILPSPSPPSSPYIWPASWPVLLTVNTAQYASTMTLNAHVSLDGVNQTSGLLVAKVGTEIRAYKQDVVSPQFGPYAGNSIFSMILYADSDDDTYTFVFYTSEGKAVPLSQSVQFVTNGQSGKMNSPLLLTN